MPIFILILNKLAYYPSFFFFLIARFFKFLRLNCLYLIKKVYKKLKKNNIKKTQRKITPNLTIYYPLPTSILSVSIRFMGAILLILVFFCTSIFLLLTVYQINFQIFSLILIVILYIIISSFGYHILNSLSHFLKNQKIDIYKEVINKIKVLKLNPKISFKQLQKKINLI